MAEKDTENNGASEIARHHRRTCHDFARGRRRRLCGWPEAAEVHATRTAEPSRRYLLRFRVGSFIRPLARERQHRRRLSPEAGLPVLALLRGRGPIRRFRPDGGRGSRSPVRRLSGSTGMGGILWRCSVAQLFYGRLALVARIANASHSTRRRSAICACAHALALRHGRSLRLHQIAGHQGRSERYRRSARRRPAGRDGSHLRRPVLALLAGLLDQS